MGVLSIRTISFLSGARCGAAVVAVAIWLFVPTTGSRIRKSAMVRIGNLVEKARQTRAQE